MTIPAHHESKTKLLDAAQRVIRAKGYAATTVDDICRAASVTKGSFFHHFKSKDELALTAAGDWATMTARFFASAPYHESQDPLQRVLGYVDFRASILVGELADYTCLLGTLVQETYATHPDIRAACEQGMSSHIDCLVSDIEAAKQRYIPHATWSAESVGNFIQSVLQGAFIFANAKQSADVAPESMVHVRRYLEMLFAGDAPPGTHFEGVKGMMLAIQYDTVAQANTAFQALAQGGQVTMPMAPSFWAKTFGMLTDRFGISWAVNGEPIDFT